MFLPPLNMSQCILVLQVICMQGWHRTGLILGMLEGTGFVLCAPLKCCLRRQLARFRNRATETPVATVTLCACASYRDTGRKIIRVIDMCSRLHTYKRHTARCVTWSRSRSAHWMEECLDETFRELTELLMSCILWGRMIVENTYI